MKKKIYYTVLSLFVIAGLFACSSKNEQQLIGKWREASGNEGIEFAKNNTFLGIFVWDLTKQPLEVRGTYSVSGDTLTLKPQSPKDLVPMTCKIKFGQSSNELALTFKQGGAVKLDGSTLAYQRIQ